MLMDNIFVFMILSMTFD